jgi:hypothetical protein
VTTDPVPVPKGPGELAARPGELDLFARIEDLKGEEDALLRIPADDRSDGQRDRLRVVGEELDRIWETLRERARRRPAHAS